MKGLSLFGAAVLVVVAACSSVPDEKVVVVPGWGPSNPGPAAGSSSGSSSGGGPVASSGSGSGSSGSSSGATSADGGAAATGLPCNIATFLAASCTGCHSDPPMASALAGLVTYADLMSTSHEDPSKNEAQLSLARMQNTASPMPPGGVPAAADVAAFQTWVNAGFPQGSCGTTSDAGAGPSGGSSSGSSSSSSGSSSGGSTGDGGVAAASGVPCDVATMFATNCTGCHSDPPVTGALAGLVTYADLMATSHEDPTKNEAQLSLSRMQNASSPMPPGGLLPAADVTTLQSWINAGYPQGSCASADGGADGAAPAPSPGVFANAPAYQPNTGPSTHNAGRDCMNCHGSGGGDAPQFDFGGTVYDGSGNPVSGAEVRFVDANGSATSVYSGPQGTFFKSGSGFAGPAHVGIRDASSMQNMMTALQSTSQPPASTGGACSACHCTGASCTMPLIHLP